MLVSAPQDASAWFDDDTAVSPNVTFTAAGPYEFSVTVTDASGVSTTSAPGQVLEVKVDQTLTSIAVTPGAVGVLPGGTCQFSAIAYDQFEDEMANQPTFSWSDSGPGQISSSGLYTAPGVSGMLFSVTASAEGISGWVAGSADVAVNDVFYQVTNNITSNNGPDGTIVSSTLAVTNAGWIQTQWPESAVEAAVSGTVTFSDSVATYTATLPQDFNLPNPSPYGWPAYFVQFGGATYDPSTSLYTVGLSFWGVVPGNRAGLQAAACPGYQEDAYCTFTVKAESLQALTVTDHNDPTDKVTVVTSPPFVGSNDLYIAADANGNAEVNLSAAFLSCDNGADMCWEVEGTNLKGTFADPSSATDIPLHGAGDYTIDAYDSNNPSDKLYVSVQLVTLTSLFIDDASNLSNNMVIELSGKNGNQSTTTTFNVSGEDVNGNITINFTIGYEGSGPGSADLLQWEIYQPNNMKIKEPAWGNFAKSDSVNGLKLALTQTGPTYLIVWVNTDGNHMPDEDEQQLKVLIGGVNGGLNITQPLEWGRVCVATQFASLSSYEKLELADQLVDPVGGADHWGDIVSLKGDNPVKRSICLPGAGINLVAPFPRCNGH